MGPADSKARRRKLWALFAAFAVVALVGAVLKNDTKPWAPLIPQRPGPQAMSAAEWERSGTCGLLTSTEVDKAIGRHEEEVPLPKLLPESRMVVSGGSTGSGGWNEVCVYNRGRSLGGRLGLAVYEEDPHQSMRQYKEIPDLGDEAFYSESAGRLVVRHRGIWLEIEHSDQLGTETGATAEEHRLVTAARQATGRLPANVVSDRVPGGFGSCMPLTVPVLRVFQSTFATDFRNFRPLDTEERSACAFTAGNGDQLTVTVDAKVSGEDLRNGSGNGQKLTIAGLEAEIESQEIRVFGDRQILRIESSEHIVNAGDSDPLDPNMRSLVEQAISAYDLRPRRPLVADGPCALLRPGQAETLTGQGIGDRRVELGPGRVPIDTCVYGYGLADFMAEKDHRMTVGISERPLDARIYLRARTSAPVAGLGTRARLLQGRDRAVECTVAVEGKGAQLLIGVDDECPVVGKRLIAAARQAYRDFRPDVPGPATTGPCAGVETSRLGAALRGRIVYSRTLDLRPDLVCTYTLDDGRSVRALIRQNPDADDYDPAVTEKDTRLGTGRNVYALRASGGRPLTAFHRHSLLEVTMAGPDGEADSPVRWGDAEQVRVAEVLVPALLRK